MFLKIRIAREKEYWVSDLKKYQEKPHARGHQAHADRTDSHKKKSPAHEKNEIKMKMRGKRPQDISSPTFTTHTRVS
jgi:hypothetical protein